MPHSPGERLGPYEIVGLIGAGGMGDVYKARDTRLERTVAIKVSKEAFSERFRNEALAIAALNHPHICTLYDVGPDYLVMEYVEGKPLHGPLPVPEVLRLAGQIADALEHAHQKRIVHRDLKPSNILVTKAGVKVLDFGVAKRTTPAAAPGDTQPTLTDEGTFVGTPRYMAPEQIDGKPADARSDIFAFGLVLYEMLTGQRAFEGRSAPGVMAAILGKDPTPDLGVEARDATGAREGGCDLPGEGSRRAMAVRPRAEARPRVDDGDGSGQAVRGSAALGRCRRRAGTRRGGHRVRDPAPGHATNAATSRAIRDRATAAGPLPLGTDTGRLARRPADRILAALSR